MSVPAERLINQFDTVEECYESQIETYKKLVEIGERQLETANTVIGEMVGKSDIQDELIKLLTQQNERYEVLLQERDDFIKSLRF